MITKVAGRIPAGLRTTGSACRLRYVLVKCKREGASEARLYTDNYDDLGSLSHMPPTAWPSNLTNVTRIVNIPACTWLAKVTIDAPF